MNNLPSSWAPFALHTPRLTLRFLTADDADSLFPLFSDPETLRYWSSVAWLHPDQARANIEQTLQGYRDGSSLRLGLVLRDGDQAGALIGTVTLYEFDRRNHRCDIGYMLGRPYWGQRYMQEALPAVISHAFGPLELHRIQADIHPDNIASERLLQSLHFQREGHLRERWFVGDEISDSIIYGLLRRDWQAAVHPAQ
ncbi:GNAT family N-acetyltransferase [Duganella sp. FT80W]|uniref:GNAT family N-acetyltransferase n=1 Tax=Duganella guangzhouensis TaxID=2666084 RepID=A0A6I2L102_9BURK|nr:GNAT family protein [Duganella guangzhouensis]MRW91543.1 GNAT family N-acetyltransferase [Duganella guangzhouensis]